MKKIERIKMIKAMEFIARQVNDEDIFETWLVSGVADGDIEYGDLQINDSDLDENNGDMWFYTKDDSFADIMDTFLHMMRKAYKSGGLYCDGVVSKPLEG